MVWSDHSLISPSTALVTFSKKWWFPLIIIWQTCWIKGFNRILFWKSHHSDENSLAEIEWWKRWQNNHNKPEWKSDIHKKVKWKNPKNPGSEDSRNTSNKYDDQKIKISKSTSARHRPTWAKLTSARHRPTWTKSTLPDMGQIKVEWDEELASPSHQVPKKG